MVYHNNEGGKCAKYIVQQLQEPAHLSAPSPFKTMYDKFAKRILWMDGNVVPGAFQMNTAWYFNVPERDPVFLEHSHGDTSELIGFFGTDPENPYDLGGEIEFTIDGEAHLLDKTTMIYLPAGISHNPVRITRVDRPIFHFSIIIQEEYDDADFYTK